MPVTDLNFDARWLQPRPQICGLRLAAHVHRQACLLPNHRPHCQCTPSANVCSAITATTRSSPLPVSISSCAWPLPNSPTARACAISRSVCVPTQQALSHGPPRRDLTQYPGQRQQGTRLAPLCELRPSPDPAGASPFFAKPEMGSVRFRVQKIRRRPWPSAAHIRPASVPARTPRGAKTPART